MAIWLLFLAMMSPHREPVEAVNPTCIIGAGAAGMSAANTLLKANKPIILLEARNRTGGRVWSSDALGGPTGPIIDLGAAWLEGAVAANPIFALATANGAVRDTWNTNYDNTIAWYSSGGNAEKDEARAEVLFDQINDKVDHVRGAKSLGSYVTAAMASLNDNDKRLVNWAYTGEVINEYASDLDKLSGSNYDQAEEFPTSKQLLFRRGYQSVFAPLTAQLTKYIQYGQVVKRIERTSTAPITSKVTTVSGKVFMCGKVIITAPLGVLKAKTITITPPISAARQGAINRLGIGVMNKVAYSIMQVGSSPADYRALRDTQEPGNWLLFAGEHASWPYPSTVHGAWMSGDVAAKKV